MGYGLEHSRVFLGPLTGFRSISIAFSAGGLGDFEFLSYFI